MHIPFCISNNLSYIRVVFIGLISIGGISGIYSYISNIQLIKIQPDDYSYGFPQVVDGIVCVSPTAANEPWFHMDEVAACNNMTLEMVNLNTKYPEWNCKLHTDYSDKSLSDVIPIFRHSLKSLIICSFLYGLFAIIHDCTIIKYKNNLNQVAFYPSNCNEDFPFTKFIFAKVDMVDGNFITYCCLGIIIGFSLLIMPLFEIIFKLCVYPFVSSCWCKKNSIIRLIKMDNARLIYKYVLSLCASMSYISSSWAAISRIGMTSSASVLTYYAISGFEESVRPLNPNKCLCSCLYMLSEYDMYKFAVITFIFIGLNLKFLWSWYRKSIHLQDYLYLIKYSLPAHIANQINLKDCTGNMMKPALLSQININKYHSINAINEEEKDNFDDKQPLLTSNVNQEQKTFNKLSYCSRITLVALAIAISWIVWVGCLLLIPIENFYQYSTPVVAVWYVAVAVCILLIIVPQYLCWKDFESLSINR